MQFFTSRDTFHCYSVVDERSGGYMALGMARQLDEPVIVITTSGTAVLNLAPSVAEAFHQRIPLVALTADRPLEVIPQFNNQWLDQEAPFYAFSKGFYQLPPEVYQPEDLEQIAGHLERLLASSISCPQGPVHINVTLEEPLYDPLPPPLLDHGKPFPDTGYAEPENGSPAGIPAGHRILVLAGMGSPDGRLLKSLELLVMSRQAVVVAEHIANLPGVSFCAHPELVMAGLNEEEKETLAPDLVLSFRGQVVSKRLKQFLQSREGLEHREISGNVPAFLEELAAQHVPGPGFSNDFQDRWKQAEDRVLKITEGRVRDLPFGNLSAVQSVLSSLPAGTAVHLGNSGVIRYALLTARRGDLTYYANRGTSGIDGSVSAAVGAAMVSETMHLLLVGDLSFVYDSNALWNRFFPGNLKIIVLNDGGGGIFRLLDGPDRMDFFEEYSVTHHPVSLELLSESYGRKCQRAATGKEFKEKLRSILDPGSTIQVLELDTAACENSRIFKDFLEFNQ
jgi:2-succinyl-5-enolpyruvyl-6-hydroxy-3-cyclohexene-1-carboxylate synthase